MNSSVIQPQLQLKYFRDYSVDEDNPAQSVFSYTGVMLDV